MKMLGIIMGGAFVTLVLVCIAMILYGITTLILTYGFVILLLVPSALLIFYVVGLMTGEILDRTNDY